MGCFLGCFGGFKDRKRRKQRNKVISRDQRLGSQKPLQSTVSPEQDITENPTNLVSELRDRLEEQSSLSTRKRVTFDTDVKSYEHVSVYESKDSLLEGEKVSEKAKKENLAQSSRYHSLPEDDSVTSSGGSYPLNHRYQNCRDSDDEVEELEDSDLDADEEQGDYGVYDEDVDDRIVSKEVWSGPIPTASMDENEEQGDYGEYDEDVDDRIVSKEVWSEPSPTASMESTTEISSACRKMKEVESRMTMCSLPEQEMKTMGSSRNVRDRSVYVHPVLNPVENLTQWKAVKSKGTPLSKPQKENFTSAQEAPCMSFGSEPSFKQSSFSPKSKCDQPKNVNQEIAVDASLSNWLVSPQTTPTKKKASFTWLETVTSDKSMPQGSNSRVSFEDRPILGALTIEELKQFSATSTPKRSPSRSPEMPLIGTVGTYWNPTGPKDSGSSSSYKGIPNTTSKYREDKRVNWHSTPFETRLERALNRGAAEA